MHQQPFLPWEEKQLRKISSSKTAGKKEITWSMFLSNTSSPFDLDLHMATLHFQGKKVCIDWSSISLCFTTKQSYILISYSINKVVLQGNKKNQNPCACLVVRKLWKVLFYSHTIYFSSLAGSEIWSLTLLIYPSSRKREQYTMKTALPPIDIKSVSRSFIFKVLFSSLSEHLFISLSSCCSSFSCLK